MDFYTGRKKFAESDNRSSTMAIVYIKYGINISRASIPSYWSHYGKKRRHSLRIPNVQYSTNLDQHS
jgi:hypothetical protein